MNKTRENVATLVKGIIDKDKGMIHVKSSALIPYYVNKSKHMFEIGPEDESELIFGSNDHKHYHEDFNEIKEHQLKLSQELGANYIFASYFYCERKLVNISTPFMILSEKETDFLVRNYYKDVPEKISKAASELGIKLFDKYYSHYAHSNIERFEHYPYDESQDINSFFKFVFFLPYEEQNLEANKSILKRWGLFSEEIFIKEYSKGKYFQEYFNQIGEYYQKKIVESIKCLERNRDLDIFLMKKGFMMGESSIIDIYKEDTKTFIKHFEKLSDESKKIVVEKIYEEAIINDEVARWLEKKYSDLLREVGFSGGN